MVEVAGNMPDEHSIEFALDTQASQGQWDCDFNLPGQAPVLTAGQVEVTTSEGTVSFAAGDMVTFPQGLSCTWNVKVGVRKHYKFG